MRALFALALIATGLAGFGLAGFGFAGIGAAEAADLSHGRSAYVAHAGASGVRARQRVIYDDQPGVYRRAYWATPWRNRHYYPFTGKKPKVGRHERLNANYPAPKPAETYYRAWSTISLSPRARPTYAAPARRFYPPVENPGPLK